VDSWLVGVQRSGDVADAFYTFIVTLEEMLQYLLLQVSKLL
jgi:hypothetical protein